jgi:hypothetical protein
MKLSHSLSFSLGDLLQYLRAHNASKTTMDHRNVLTTADLSACVMQVADAMVYLEALRVVHRDLAAR